MTAPVTHLIVGPAEHGVTRFGLELVDTLGHNDFQSPMLRATTFDPAVGPPATGGVHLQFTDRLFGAGPEQAADAVRTLVDGVARGGGRVTATLHDLPQPSDGPNHHRRRAAYAEVAALVDGVVVSSEHERALAAEAGLRPRRLAVIPLPIGAHPGPATVHDAGVPSVGIFGFVYPGKGHAEVIAALDGIAPDVEIVALGAPSAGHAELAGDLSDLCARAGRRFRMTGHVADADVVAALRAVTVPIAPHRHVSASGSLNSWLAAGRRPLAPANRYTREIGARNPTAVLLYPDTPEGLQDALAAALARPATTWLPPGTTCTPTRDDAARQYADLLARWHR